MASQSMKTTTRHFQLVKILATQVESMTVQVFVRKEKKIVTLVCK